jgi:hypothetical protein
MDANKRKEAPEGDQHAAERAACPPGQGIKPSTIAAPVPHQYYASTGELDKDLARLEDDQFEALADTLKTKGSRAGLWTENQNVALARIVKTVEDGAAVGGSTAPFWESVEVDMEAEKVRPGTKAGAWLCTTMLSA